MKKVVDFIKKYWVTFVLFVLMILVYHLMSSSEDANNYLFPPASKIWEAFMKDKSIFLVNMMSSFGLLIPSLAVAIGLSLLVGIPVGLNEKLRNGVYPVLYTISVIPSILLSPFALMLAPNFKAASLFLIIYGCMFPTLFATITGIQTIDKRYLDNAATLDLNRFEMLTRVILPAASPSIFSGLVTTMRGSFLMLVYAEMYGAKYGMGYYVRKYSEFGMYQNTWSGFIFMVLVLVVIMQIFERIKSHLLKWTIN